MAKLLEEIHPGPGAIENGPGSANEKRTRWRSRTVADEVAGRD